MAKRDNRPLVVIGAETNNIARQHEYAVPLIRALVCALYNRMDDKFEDPDEAVIDDIVFCLLRDPFGVKNGMTEAQWRRVVGNIVTETLGDFAKEMGKEE